MAAAVGDRKLSIQGAWTKAGIASCIHLKGADKQDDLLLDCGTCEPSTFTARAVLISHGHIDHAGCCINHARGLALMYAPPTYYVPHEIVEPLTAAKAAYEAMNGAEIPMNIVAVTVGDEFMATPNVKVRPFQTEHRVPSQGYALYTVRKGGLLPELAGLTGREIHELKKSGRPVTAPSTEHLEVVYTGDTVFNGLLRQENAFVFKAPILIMEVTYLDGKVEKAVDRGHIHLEDVLEHAHLFQNEEIIFVHLSAKYSASRALEILRNRLPPDLASRVKVNLSSFRPTSNIEFLSSVDDVRWARRQRTEAGWGWTHPSSASSSAVVAATGSDAGSTGSRSSSGKHNNNRHSNGNSNGNNRHSNNRGNGNNRHLQQQHHGRGNPLRPYINHHQQQQQQAPQRQRDRSSERGHMYVSMSSVPVDTALSTSPQAGNVGTAPLSFASVAREHSGGSYSSAVGGAGSKGRGG